jgi:hypothetical protein
VTTPVASAEILKNDCKHVNPRGIYRVLLMTGSVRLVANPMVPSNSMLSNMIIKLTARKTRDVPILPA